MAELKWVLSANGYVEMPSIQSSQRTFNNLAPISNTAASANNELVRKGEMDAAIAAGGGGSVSSVNTQTGAVVLDADDIDDSITTHKFVASGDLTKLGFISVTGDADLDTLAGKADKGSTNTFTNTQTISVDSTVNDTLLLTSDEDSSNAAPILTLSRVSSSPDDGDYLGQIKFKGENDLGGEVTYSKITGKTSDVTDSSEDGLIEFMNKLGGANTIVARLTGDTLKLINGTGIEVDGEATFTNVPSCSDAAVSANDLVNKSYVDTADVAIIAGSMLRSFAHSVTVAHTYTGGATFTTVAPTTSVTPASANDIVNKAYVDAATGGDSADSGPKTFLAIGSSTASLANTTIDITWATPEISDSDITLSSNELTFAVAGTYTIDLSARMSGNNRVEAILRTFKDTGGGYSELTNHTASNYTLRDTDQDTGSTVLSTMLTLAAGDKLKFQITGDTDGTAVLMTEGTILRIVGYV